MPASPKKILSPPAAPPSPPKPGQPPPPDARWAPLNRLHEMASQPRTVFKGIHELAASMKEGGQIEPLVVRPSKVRPGAFEIVVGARRFRAAKFARIGRLLVIVRDLTDHEAARMQVVENDQRDPVHPVEEAAAFLRLHQDFGESVPAIAAGIGRDEAFVRARLKLCALIPEARQAYLDDKVRALPALWIARIPAALQASALADVVALGESPDDKAVRKLLLSRYTLRLDTAPWQTADASLVPKAGPCTRCPKRTGNQPELFEDVADRDTCTDPTCFAAKGDAHWARVKQQAKKDKAEVIEGVAADRLFPTGATIAKGAAYADLDGRAEEDPRGRTYRELFGPVRPPLAVVRNPWSGAVQTLVKREHVPKALERAGHDFAPKVAAVEAAPAEPSEEQRSQLFQRERAAHVRAVDTALERLEQHATARAASLTFFRQIFAGLLRGAADEQVIELARRRGWTSTGSRPSLGVAWEAIEREAEEMGEPALRALCLSLAVSRGAYDAEKSPILIRACRVFGVDLQAIERASRAKEGLVDQEPGEQPVEAPAAPKKCRCCYAGEEHEAIFVEPDLCRTCRNIGTVVEETIASFDEIVRQAAERKPVEGVLPPTRTQDDICELVAAQHRWPVTRVTQVFLDRVAMGRIYPDHGNKGLVRTVRAPVRKRRPVAA